MMMWRPASTLVAIVLLRLSGNVQAEQRALQYYTTAGDLLPNDPLVIFDDRPKDCPPCFNCNLDDFVCHQFANCTKSSGKCKCPDGFGGNDCSEPLCGSLAEGSDRLPPQGDEKETGCKCHGGWEGINCNVCKTDDACNALMPEGKDGVCYRDGLLQKENYQMCNITNRKILDQLKTKIPQATFSCNAAMETCNFQFWIEHRESFYCALDTCNSKFAATENQNKTTYHCENIKCRCIPGRMLCGEDGSVDIGDFLDQEIRGPATFTSTSTVGGGPQDGSTFSEPNMNDLISSVFGDKSITLRCRSGECLHKTEVPGYERPVKKINTPLIAGVIAGCALFVVAVVLLIFFLSRRNARFRYGPIHLTDDEEDENAKLLADHKPAALFFEHVSYFLKGKQILSGVTGSVHPGELLAIMGASGAGKTTFLDILARKNKRGSVAGSFYLNGEKVPDEDFKSVIGFVDQEDTMLPTLTVHETILDSALLRLPREMSYASKVQKVEDVEKQLGIFHIRHQYIGNEESRGISGGERRRVAIACELVTSPSILFLDEPTSGLDAFNAFNVIECLVTLVKTYNRTVIFTIHQPRSNIVALFDQLILLAKGRTVYSGPFEKCQGYFDSIGYECPSGFNIADYLVDLTMHAGVPHSPIPEDDPMFGGGEDSEGRMTRASSAMAVKSLPSVSNMSVGTSTSAEQQLVRRPSANRKSSVRQQQERQLFTRKNTTEEHASTQTPASVRSADSLLEPPSDGDRLSWVKLSRQVGRSQPSQISEDTHDLPPTAADATGTNLDNIVLEYEKSDVAGSIRDDIRNAVHGASESNGHLNGGTGANGVVNGKVKGYRKPRIYTQFFYLSRRTWRNLYRNPMLMLTHYAIAIVLAVFLGFLFYGLTDDLKGFQNRLGFFFFLLALFGFSALTSLTVFGPERLLFVRERAKGYYSPLAFYLSKIIFDIVPLRLIPPIITGCIVYPMTGLIAEAPNFFKFMLFLVLFNFAAAMICLFIGVCLHNQGVASLLGVLVMLFSLLFGGFLLNHETIPKPFLWLQLLSIFHYGFEGLIVNEVRYLTLVDKKYGLDIEVPGSAILSSFGFNVLALWQDVIGLAVICGVFLLLGYVVMHFFLVERR